MASDYYFHEDTKKIYKLLDDSVCFMWDDRNKDPFLATQYFPILEIESQTIFIIEADDFEDEFIPINKENFDEIHEWYGFDELTKQRIKNEMFKVND